MSVDTVIQRTRLPLVQPHPRLPLPAPVQQAHWTRVQRPTGSRHVVTPQPVLVPSVPDGLHVTTEHQQEGGQRPQLVHPVPPLQFHPILYLLPKMPLPPPTQIHHHHTRVEVAGAPGTRPERLPGQDRVGPESIRENDVRVQVDDPGHARVEQRVLQSGSDRGGDPIEDRFLAEYVHLEVERWENGADDPGQDPGG
ncbi:eukaryotic translation initiation factor 3C [Striga asiatica]|uniref:Eukaryotic translation initiation factor 3C n=1 Tax=Striga asiatica TaxID=4170 RepID=A0A5A7R273_STRAF|nr:eukaryotic translation initiation factor 3C [Striga asiatica]